MREKASVQLGLGVALSAALPSLENGHKIALAVVVAILLLSSLVLYIHDKFSNKIWITIVDVANSIDVVKTAFGFGFSGTGISLLVGGWFPLGVILLTIGCATIGAGIGQNILRLFPRREV